MKQGYYLLSLLCLFFPQKGLCNINVPTALWVNKATNQLLVTQWSAGLFKIIRKYHTTLGRALGDKQDAHDLKTPEGIYFFRSKQLAPQLPKKCGSMGFYLNFPNPFDRILGKTGSGIMLHGTHEPQRLKKNYDSEGCVVVDNHEIEEIQHWIRLPLTPIIIVPELDLRSLELHSHDNWKTFLEGWLKSWKDQDLSRYLSYYHPQFTAQGKTKTQWGHYKNKLNQLYSKIEIQMSSPLFYPYSHYSVATFQQNYRSQLHNGQWGHRSQGTKILYLVPEANSYKIISEQFTPVVW